MAGRQCPLCLQGSLSALLRRPGRQGWAHRCSRKGCQAYIAPQHGHPLLSAAAGSSSTSLQRQAALLFLLLCNVPYSKIVKILGMNHKQVELMGCKLREVRASYVIAKERDIRFGDGKDWFDVEADEATFDKKDVTKVPGLKHKASGKNVMMWEQWCGIVERGRPQSLVLHRLNPKLTPKRAPGPGPIRKVEWSPLAKKHLKDKLIGLPHRQRQVLQAQGQRGSA